MLQSIRGTIRRRILINYRLQPRTVAHILPPAFQLRLVGGNAMVGVCLIRLERMRPSGLPGGIGLASDNVAYRVAVDWKDPESHDPSKGVYIPRRDTSSSLQRAFGGRLFPGEYHHSRFDVTDNDGRIAIGVRSEDGGGDVELEAVETDCFPTDSVFSSLEEASQFFEEGSVGYSAKEGEDRLDGLLLLPDEWAVRPLSVLHARATFIERLGGAARAVVSLDNALIMRDVAHEWRPLPALDVDGR